MSQTPLGTHPIRTGAQATRNSRYEYLDIACTPANEKCTQAGEHPLQENKLECTVYIDQLIREFGTPPEGCSYFILENNHDELGIYYEAAILFDEKNEAAAEYAFKVEDGCENWDETSKEQLKEANYSLLSDNSGGKPGSHLRRA